MMRDMIIVMATVTHANGTNAYFGVITKERRKKWSSQILNLIDIKEMDTFKCLLAHERKSFFKKEQPRKRRHRD